MSPIEPATQSVSDTGASPGPGQRLREAREAADLSQAEVATRLHLDRKTVAHLERDEYDRLPAPTFVRGYLAGYARLLDLPKGPIIEAYERHGHAPPSLVPDIASTPQVRISDLPMRMVTYLIAGLLVVLVVLWWQNRQPISPTPDDLAQLGDTPAATVPAATETATGDASGVARTSAPHRERQQNLGQNAGQNSGGSSGDAPGPTSAVAGLGTTAQPPAGDTRTVPLASQAAQTGMTDADADAQALASASPAADAGGRARLPAAASTTPAPAEVRDPATVAAAPSESDSAEPAPSEPSAPSAGAAEAAAGAVAGAAPDAASTDGEPATPHIAPLPGSDVIIIRFSQESWVEIYDREGARLYYSLAPADGEVVVTGAGPMRVLLGAVEGATVIYNGERFDLTPFRGRTVARFTVGEEPERVSPPPETSTDPAGEQAARPAAPRPGASTAHVARPERSLEREAPPTPARAAPAPDTTLRTSFGAEH